MFGVDISKYDLELINRYSQNRTYADTDATNFPLGLPQKTPLEDPPFVCILNYVNGGAKYGYWAYNHMVLKLEYEMYTMIVILSQPVN